MPRTLLLESRSLRSELKPYEFDQCRNLIKGVDKMPESTNIQVIEKLDQILKVLSIQVAADKSLTERARLLKLAGLENQAIAEVLNTTPETVRVLTSNLRRPKTKRRGPAVKRTVARKGGRPKTKRRGPAVKRTVARKGDRAHGYFQ
jgi:DNA-binding CsgD family transcriptional regulator